MRVGTEAYSTPCPLGCVQQPEFAQRFLIFAALSPGLPATWLCDLPAESPRRSAGSQTLSTSYHEPAL